MINNNYNILLNKYDIYINDSELENQYKIYDKVKSDFLELQNYIRQYETHYRKSIFNYLVTSINHLIENQSDSMTSNKAFYIYFCMSMFHDKVVGKTLSDMRYAKENATSKALIRFDNQIESLAGRVNKVDQIDQIDEVDQVEDLDWIGLFYDYLSETGTIKNTFQHDIDSFEEINFNCKYIPCVSKTGMIDYKDIIYLVSHAENILPVGFAVNKQAKVHHGTLNIGESKFCTMLHDMGHGEFITIYKQNGGNLWRELPAINEAILSNSLTDKEIYLIFYLLHEANITYNNSVFRLFKDLKSKVPSIQCLFKMLNVTESNFKSFLKSGDYHFLQKNKNPINSENNKDLIQKNGLGSSVDLKYALRELGYNIPYTFKHDGSLIRANNFIFIAMCDLVLSFIETQPSLCESIGLTISSIDKDYLLNLIEEYNNGLDEEKYYYSQKMGALWESEYETICDKIQSLELSLIHESGLMNKLISR